LRSAHAKSRKQSARRQVTKRALRTNEGTKLAYLWIHLIGERVQAELERRLRSGGPEAVPLGGIEHKLRNRVSFRKLQ